MKKRTTISLCLCAALLLSCFVLPASALPVEVTETVVATEASIPQQTEGTEQNLIGASSNLPFGRASIQEGCRTIDGMKPLAGSERRLATAQGVFAYEVNSGTVIYSYNPDVKLSTGTFPRL